MEFICIMKYYKSTNRYTQISGHSWIINRLKYDTDFLFAVVKSINPVDFYKHMGCRLTDDIE